MQSSQATFDQLRELKLLGFYEELKAQLENRDYQELEFFERVQLLVEREYLVQKNKRLAARLKRANFRIDACLEDLSYRADRNLDRNMMLRLGECEWIQRHQNIILTGPAGAGKTHIACALGHRACLRGYKVQYFRFAKFFAHLQAAKEKNRILNFFKSLARLDVLILDDWALCEIDQNKALDLLEVFEDRYNLKSTIVTSQFPVDTWYEKIEDATLAEAILDRLVHNSHRIDVQGSSVRKNPIKKEETSNS